MDKLSYGNVLNDLHERNLPITANTIVDGKTSEEVLIMREVRLGMSYRYTSLTIILTKSFSEALEDRKQRIIVNGVVINKLKYIDST